MYDIITIGSASVDAFVGTDTRKFTILHKAMEEDVCIPIGAKILIKKLIYDTGGGGTNTAVAFSRLGLKTGWIGKIGNDQNSRHILAEMKKEKVDFLGKQSTGGTGFSIILIGIDKNRTILAYKGINDQLNWNDIKTKKTKWLYIGSMLNQSYKTTEKLAEYARKNKIKYTFNPSMYLAQKSLKGLLKIVHGCEIIVLNKEEARALTGTTNLDSCLKKIQKHAKIAVITDGPNNAYAYNGIQKYTLIPRPVRVAETTGAGDAFASGFTAGYITSQDIEYSMQMAYAESSSVIQHIGAKRNLLTSKQIKELIKKRPCRIIKETI